MPRRVLAECNTKGARVCIVEETFPAPASLGGRMVSVPTEGPDGCPEWVTVGRGLIAKRIREYLNETGRLPTRELLERFGEVMGKRLDDFIRDPRNHPWRPMGLREFEIMEAQA